MLLVNCQMSAPLELKGYFPLSLENQFANSIRIRVKTYHRAMKPLLKPFEKRDKRARRAQESFTKCIVAPLLFPFSRFFSSYF